MWGRDEWSGKRFASNSVSGWTAWMCQGINWPSTNFEPWLLTILPSSQDNSLRNIYVHFSSPVPKKSLTMFEKIISFIHEIRLAFVSASITECNMLSPILNSAQNIIVTSMLEIKFNVQKERSPIPHKS
jgi:hypothetical protein